uniref:RNA helicase n=1 Tax=Neobenedenia girellae TaxID=280698 RepID=A1IIT3_9PLAT|nr:RNA helicase [Neobenedenia girellae]
MSNDFQDYQDGLNAGLSSMNIRSESSLTAKPYQPPHLRNQDDHKMRYNDNSYEQNDDYTYMQKPYTNSGDYNSRGRRGGYQNRGGERGYRRGSNFNGYSRGGNRSFDANGSVNNRNFKSFDANYQNRSFNNYRNDYVNKKDWNEQKPRDDREESEIFKNSNTGIRFDDYDNIPVSVTGPNYDANENILQCFTDLDLHKIIRDNVELARYSRPTPVQKYAVPIIAAGRDLMACAQTGSGKTAAFLIPMLNNMFVHGPADSLDRCNEEDRRAQFPTGLVIAPTRELASQIYDEAKKFSYRSHVRPCVVYGGAAIKGQLSDLSRGCNVIFATPGRLIDIIDRGKLKLDCCRFLVLDEADRMLDMGFEPQIREIIQRYMPNGDNRQTLMFSATFPPQIQNLAKDFLKSYIFLSVGRVGSTSENITQSLVWVEEVDKRNALLDFIDFTKEDNLTLVFVETKRGADSLEEFLYNREFSVSSIHGDRTQDERERALKNFRSGKTPIMVATAVAARGLDIPNVKHVINYDLPNDIDEYVHRIGRTGRVGNLGKATSFFNDKNKNLARDLVELLEEANQEVPSWLRTSGYDNRSNQSFHRNRGRRGGNGNFGGRDFRQGYQKSYGNGNGGEPNSRNNGRFNFGGGQNNVPSNGGLVGGGAAYYLPSNNNNGAGKDIWWN